MRIVLLFATNAFGLLCGKGLLWVVSSVLPAKWDGAKTMLINDKCGSIVAAVAMTAMLALVFLDDGRKHAAYEDWDALMVSVTEIIMLLIYFVPMIFYNENDITKAMKTCYYIFYFPCRWLMLFFGCDIKTAAVIGIAIILAVQLVLYLISYYSYKKKHPFIFKPNVENSI
jgi:hypothetical protein